MREEDFVFHAYETLKIGLPEKSASPERVMAKAKARVVRTYRKTDIPTIPKQVQSNLDRMKKERLSPLERAEIHLQNKALYEEKNPEVKKGIYGRKGEAILTKPNEMPSYPVWASKELRGATRSVQQEIQIARDIAGSVKAQISGEPLERNKTGLLAIARLGKSEQISVVNKVLKEGFTLNDALNSTGRTKAKPKKSKAPKPKKKAKPKGKKKT